MVGNYTEIDREYDLKRNKEDRRIRLKRKNTIKLIEDALKMTDAQVREVIIEIIKEIITSPDFKINIISSISEKGSEYEAFYAPSSKMLAFTYNTAYHAKDYPNIFLNIVTHEMLHRIDFAFLQSKYAKKLLLTDDIVRDAYSRIKMTREKEQKKGTKETPMSDFIFGDDRLSDTFDTSDYYGSEYINDPSENFTVLSNLKRFFDLNNIEINKENIRYMLEEKESLLPMDFKLHFLDISPPGANLISDEVKSKKNRFSSWPIEHKVDFLYKSLTKQYKTFSEDVLLGGFTTSEDARKMSKEERKSFESSMKENLKSKVKKYIDSK